METNFNFKSILQVWDEYHSLFVFSDDGSVSCRLCFDHDGPNATISDLYVQEDSRRKGGATAIINWCLKEAKAQKCLTVSLRSDNDDWIREWYKRMGFEVESSQVWLKKVI